MVTRLLAGTCALLAIFLSPAAWADAGRCGDPDTTSLGRITGAGGQPLPEGEAVIIEATVSGSFPGDRGLNGFFVESSSPRVGLFVYAPDVSVEAAPAAEERWRIRGRTGRFRGRIQLEQIDSLTRCGTDAVNPPTVSAAELSEPADYADRLVRLKGPLTVTDTYWLGRYGSLRLAIGGRQFARHSGVTGGRPFPVLLDDGSYRRDPRPVPHLNEAGVRRAGDRLEMVTGVITRAFGEWRLHPVSPPELTDANPRPTRPPARAADGDLRVVQFNLRNYFIDRGGRGPDTEAGFERQRTRLRATLRALDGDLLVLHEIQNRVAAVRDLVEWLNDDQPAEQHYQSVLAERSAAVIRSIILYRSDRLVLERAGRHVDRAHARDPVAAVFRDPNGERLVIAGAHFKSRGGCPETGDVDRGQGCWAERREAEARSLARWLDGWVGAGPLSDAPVMVLADLNAYARERAVQRLMDAGLEDQLAERVPARQRYGYVYRGRAGYLDHVLATEPAATRIRQLASWPVNADEPAYLAREGAGVWRASDHDPLVIDLDLSH